MRFQINEDEPKNHFKLLFSRYFAHHINATSMKRNERAAG